MQERQPKLIKLGKNEYQYEDFYGNKSEVFYQAVAYKFGFARVKKDKISPVKQRDMLGRISSLKTISGVYFYHFVHGKMAFENLPDKYFADQVFYEGVKLAMLDKLALQIQEKSQNGQHIDIRWVKKEKDKIIDLCNEKRANAQARLHPDKTGLYEILEGEKE